MSLLLILVPIALLLLGFPIFAVLLSTATVIIVFIAKLPDAVLHQTLFSGLFNPSLLAVPYFVLAGEIMARGSVAQRLIDLVEAGARKRRGGLALTAVGSSALFGVLSGSSAASVATIGRILHPAMLKRGYPATFAAGLVTAVGAVDVVIPPSIALIVYGLVAEQSVLRLYLAGIFPGIVLTILLGIYVWYRARRCTDDGIEVPVRHRGATLSRSLLPLGLPLVVLGSMYGGFASPTEAAILACVYATVLTVFIYRELGWADILDSARVTALFCGQVLVIAACANTLAWLMITHQIPGQVADFVAGYGLPSWSLLLVINLLLLAVGCVLDPISAILMFTPLLLPIVEAAGVNPIHFGIVMTVNLAIGLFSPPFGINIFVAQSALGIPAQTIYRGILPFIGVYVLALVLITYVPAIAMSGPGLFLTKAVVP